MEIKLKAESRSDSGKGAARRVRREGKVPAVLYGPDIDSQALVVDGRSMLAALHTEAGMNVLINLEYGSDSFLTMLKEVQRHPIRGDLLHVDFVNVDRNKAVQASVPLHVVGESRGVREGGVVEHHLHEVMVEALPSAVPSALEIDITDLGIGDNLRVSSLQVPQGVTVLNDPEEVLLAVIEPQVIELPEPTEGAEGEAVAAGEGEAPEAAAEEGGQDVASSEESAG